MTLANSLPVLEYPVTRQFGSKILTLVAYTIGFVTLVFLSIVNVALVGYEPNTVLREDFYSSQSFWFDKFIPSFAARQSGKSCDGHLFTVGDTVFTSASLFEWKLQDLGHPDPGTGSFLYKGETLKDCDIIRVAFYGDIRVWAMETSIYISCSPDVVILTSRPSQTSPRPSSYSELSTPQILAIASVGLSGLTAMQRGMNFRRLGQSSQHSAGMHVIEKLLWIAWFDIASQLSSISQASNNTSIAAFSVTADLKVFCPQTFIRDNTHHCDEATRGVPKFDWVGTTAVLSSNALEPVYPFDAFRMNTDELRSYQLEEALNVTTTNFIQLIRAAALIDIGNEAANNFLTHPNIIDDILVAQYPSPLSPSSPPPPPVRSRLYEAWKSDSDDSSYGKTLLATIPVPSTLRTVFICHFYKLKSPGSLFVSVLVATLSMFSSAWGLAFVVASYVVKRRRPQANCCHGHGASAQTAYSTEVEGFDHGKQESINGSTAEPTHEKSNACLEKWDPAAT